MISKSAVKKAGRSGPEATLAAQTQEMERTLTEIRQILRRPLASAFAEGELTGAQRAVMGVLVSSSKAMSLSELRQSLGLAQSTVSGIVARLVKRGLIAREADTVDGRSTLLAPSKAVREFLEKRMPELVRSPLAHALRLAGEAERKSMAAALRRLRELLEEASSGAERID